ncbi:MAG: 5-formyltetrahydrofolate cyclo-ligase [Lachnospiraceae bacterium]|jgi:5-formyltetrahydrofolate cyclo-ligase
MDKESIRKNIIERKRALGGEEIEAASEKLMTHFFGLSEYKSAKAIYAYMSFNQEPDTGRIIARAIAEGKRVAVPRTFEGGGMEFVFLETAPEIGATAEITFAPDNKAAPKKNTAPENNGAPCPAGFTLRRGIAEPVSGEIADVDALVIVPGLAFDKTGARTGYGGGYYDRYFAAHRDRSFVKVALCYDFQIVDSLESDPHDVAVDYVISPGGVVRIKGAKIK